MGQLIRTDKIFCLHTQKHTKSIVFPYDNCYKITNNDISSFTKVIKSSSTLVTSMTIAPQK